MRIEHCAISSAQTVWDKYMSNIISWSIFGEMDIEAVSSLELYAIQTSIIGGIRSQ